MFEEVTKTTYNNIAEDFSQKTHFPVFRRLIESSITYFMHTLPFKGRILILGSGDGRDAEIFMRKGYEVTLLDYSEKMVEIAKKKLPEAEVILKDMRELDFQPNSFDGVWASTCLYHVQKKFIVDVLTKVYDSLRPNGSFYFNLKKGVGEKLVERPPSYPQGGRRFYAFYDTREVLQLIDKFDILQVKCFDDMINDQYIQVWVKKVVNENF